MHVLCKMKEAGHVDHSGGFGAETDDHNNCMQAIFWLQDWQEGLVVMDSFQNYHLYHFHTLEETFKKQVICPPSMLE